jgi:predicted nuclease with TOPRIM domain
VENGRASLLLKSSSKRKRTKEELEEVKLEESALMEDRHSYLQQVKRLKQEHAEMMEALHAIEAQQQLQMD